jgi:hypothetical protein
MPPGPTSILVTGDMLQITVPPPAVVPMAVAPVPLVGTSSKVMIMGMPACLEGDELPPMLRSPVPYMAPPYVTPGVGQFSLMLLPSNKTSKGKDSSKKLLLKGATFQAKFQVSSPAMMPTPAGPQPDPLMVKMCTAQFITTQSAVEKG